VGRTLPAKGEIPDGPHIERLVAARPRYKSYDAAITGEIDLTKVHGNSDEAKRKRLTRKASEAIAERKST
jgi:hypothetical protein